VNLQKLDRKYKANFEEISKKKQNKKKCKREISLEKTKYKKY
jgi:hypothetical protein